MFGFWCSFLFLAEINIELRKIWGLRVMEMKDMKKESEKEINIAEKKVKIVIGANFGDEGKGLMTDYFCREASARGEKCLVICHNGGCQRGHTVVREDGVRHVFHHFGSGSFAGADTYLSEDFIANPMVFRREWEELEQAGCRPGVWMHPKCRITTPFDMVLNQLVEEKRSHLRHGSCGMGIFETICRYEAMGEMGVGFGLRELQKEGMQGLLRIRDEYFLWRLETLGIVMDEEWKAIVFQEGLLVHYLEDLLWMRERVGFAEVSLFDGYDVLVFEGGQGLLLDQGNQEYFPHLTPSNTGLKNPARLLKEWSARALSGGAYAAEVCYVTRPYLTRHGAGRLDLECNKEEINAEMTDLTNVPNPYQGTLRYGKMDVARLKERIFCDFGGLKDWKCSLAITHRNETEALFAAENLGDEREFFSLFDGIYVSYREGEGSVQRR